MKVEIDLPEIEGYEYTGEYRSPQHRDDYLDQDGCLYVGSTGCSVSSRHILRKKRWRASHGEKYIAVNSYAETIVCMDTYCKIDDKCFEVGNYFKPGSEEAQAMADKIKQLLKEE